MSERCDPEFFQVLVCQIRKDAKVDVILSDALSVLPETDLSSQSETCCIAAAPAASGSTARQQAAILVRCPEVGLVYALSSTSVSGRPLRVRCAICRSFSYSMVSLCPG
jgi:hypothetical protein